MNEQATTYRCSKGGFCKLRKKRIIVILNRYPFLSFGSRKARVCSRCGRTYTSAGRLR